MPVQIRQDWYERSDKVAIYTAKLNQDPGDAAIIADMDEKIIAAIRQQGDRQQHSTNVKAQMTDWIMNTTPGFKELIDLATTVVKEISGYQYNRPKLNFLVPNCWGMIYRQAEHAVPHMHYPALWSVVYYVRAPQGSGALHFPALQQDIVPEDSLLVVFPGDLQHLATPTTADVERIVVAMNFHDLR
jgi:hypothetical protein